MDSAREFPSATAGEGPLSRNAPLAPTQELAYRKKCIQLKRRLAEIEANNDSTRKRILQETEHVQKMRLLRAILLNHLNEAMSAPAKRLTDEQLEKLGVLASNGNAASLAEMAGGAVSPELARSRPEGEGLLDDSSEESDEDEPEPVERPERRRRANNTSYRETIMNTNPPGEPASNLAYQQQQSTLADIAPANSFSPIAPGDPAALTSSFRLNTPQAVGTDSRYGESSPAAGAGGTMPYGRPPSLPSNSVDVNGTTTGRPSAAMLTRPVRPESPFIQFTAHMRPQLEADDYDPELIPLRIQEEWEGLSAENRKLWDDRYQDQMREYTIAMDAYKKATRREASGSGFSSVNSVG